MYAGSNFDSFHPDVRALSDYGLVSASRGLSAVPAAYRVDGGGQPAHAFLDKVRRDRGVRQPRSVRAALHRGVAAPVHGDAALAAAAEHQVDVDVVGQFDPEEV